MKNFSTALKASAAVALSFSLAACSSTSSSASTSASSAASTAGSATTTAAVNSTWDLLDTTNLVKADLDLSNAGGELKSILDSGKLVVATSPDFPPAEYMDSTTGKVKGAEMMLATYIAYNLGVDLEIETMDFNAVLTSVDTGKADLAISGFGYKKDRAENFELSTGYSGTGSAACHTLLTFTDTVDDYKTLDDYSGKTIAAQTGSLQQMYVEDEIPGATLELVTSIDQGILDLQSKKVDAMALPCSNAQNYADSSDGLLAKSTVEFDLTPYAEYAGQVVAAKKGETSLIDAVNSIIQTMTDNGYYSEWYLQACADAGVEPGDD